MKEIKVIVPTKASATTGATAEPHWSETTVRWLRSKRPEYLRTSAAESSVHQLARALARMSWKKLESDDAKATNVEYNNLCNEIAGLWTKTDHDELVAWLAKGGYANELKERNATLMEMTTNEDDHVALALTPDEVAQAIGKLKAPSIEITLAEIVADADREAMNPDAGSW